MSKRNHNAHPPSAVKPSSINKSPNYTPGSSVAEHTTHGQPKGSGEVPKANNAGDGTNNHNDSPAGTAGFIITGN
jgi:hypothetical protein